MSRHKRPPHPMLKLARAYLRRLAPELRPGRFRLRQLDGPPGSARFAVSADMCCREAGCASDAADASHCQVASCPNRRAIRMLLGREGQLIQVINNDLCWEK